MWILILIGVVLFVLYKKLFIINYYWKERGVPYVRPWPLIGNMSDVVFQKKEVSQIIKQFYDAFPNERYVGLYQFRRPTLLIRDTKLIKTITIKEFASFPEHCLFNNDDNDKIDNKGLFSLGAKSGWADMRKHLNQAFTLNKLKRMFPVIDECGEELLSYLRQHNKTAVIDLKETFSKLSCNILAKTMLGVTCNCFEEPLPKLYYMGNEINDFSGIKFVRMFAMSISRTLTKLLGISLASKEVVSFFFSLIKESVRKNKDKSEYDMSYLLTSDLHDGDDIETTDSIEFESNPKRKKVLSEDEIVMQLFGFFIGGFDAIPAFLSYAFYELAVNSDVQERLYQEINTNKDDLYDTLISMKYLDMVTSEVLRKWPITVFIDRKCVKEFVIEPEQPHETKLVVEPGVICWIPIYSIHRDSKYYPHPEKFDPERFAEQVQRSTYFPFGSGPRTCIASKFSVYVCKLILVKLLSNYQILSCEGTVPPAEVSKIVIFLSGGGRIHIKVLNMSSSTINDCSERTDIKDQRLKNSKTLPSKIYKPRNSPLTDLFAENKHFKSAYNLVMAMFLGTVISVAATEYANEGRVYLGFRTVHGAFRNFRYAFLIWPFLFSSTLAAYYSFTVWVKIRIHLKKSNKTYIKYDFIKLNLKKLWDVSCLTLFVLYYPSLLYFSFKAVIIYDLGIAASFAVLMETTRCLMKVHAFVRSNCPKYTQKTNGTLHPTFNHYIYFLFSPALVYKDYYPRCNDPIKWKLAAVQVLEMVLGVIFFSLIYEKKFSLQLNDYGIRTYTWINILTFILEHFYEGLLLFLLFFYSGLHTYLNITSEVLGFSDRLFYEVLNMSSSTIHYRSEKTDTIDQRQQNSKTLPSKIYKPRNSPLTDLFAENKHFKPAYNLVMAMFLGTVISVAVTEYANEGRVYLGFRTLDGAFRNFRYAFLIWPFLFLSTLAAYYSFTVWAKIRIQLKNANKTYIKYDFINLNLKKLWDILSLSLFVLYYPSLFYFAFKAVIIYDLGIAASFAILMETTRCLMKVHAFVRSNCPKYTQKTNEALHPTFNHYIYFLFSPALVYKDHYPRCNDPIKWKLTAVQVLEMILVIIFCSIIYEKKFLLELNDYGIRTYTWINILTFILEHFYEGLLFFLLFFYSSLHTYLNITSELLRFSDRLFYKEGWSDMVDGSR
ncbi:hypothetical protein RN001_013181 [Aquatica leii]|uniref:Cytochrome P450 n=1 Tax=Aquatica leii TaxID=1421715 RepID=A0AAN7P204_9COLE|nr:hypothetical protein RN001_013181 [Aquatica leii]